MTKPRFKRQTILLWPVRIYRQKGILIESFLSLNSIRLQKQSPCANEALHIYFIKENVLRTQKKELSHSDSISWLHTRFQKRGSVLQDQLHKIKKMKKKKKES